jgi:hypothetical protein
MKASLMEERRKPSLPSELWVILMKHLKMVNQEVALSMLFRDLNGKWQITT